MPATADSALVVEMPAYIPVYPSLNGRRGALCKLSSSSKELSRVRARKMSKEETCDEDVEEQDMDMTESWNGSKKLPEGHV